MVKHPPDHPVVRVPHLVALAVQQGALGVHGRNHGVDRVRASVVDHAARGHEHDRRDVAVRRPAKVLDQVEAAAG